MGLGIPGESTWGVQFHPESFLTPEGDHLLKAFVDGLPCPEDLGGFEIPNPQEVDGTASPVVPLEGEAR